MLGAGFSQAAGLPLGRQLWEIIQSQAGNRLDRDIEDYLRYRRECDGVTLGADDIDFEDFLSFLDLDHHLGLKGSDNWEVEGGYSQQLVKSLIGKALVERTPPAESLPEAYYDFASQLAPGDRVLTFNYDVLLERAMDSVGKPYRLFQERYSEVRSTYGVCDSSGKDEVVLLKPHGSVDWFDRAGYAEREENLREFELDATPKHPVFATDADVGYQKLLEGPQLSDERLCSVYRVVDGLDDLYRGSSPGNMVTPFLLTPSKAKAIYADHFRSFWWDIAKGGAYRLGIVVIGYSLPQHDEYAKQALWCLLRSYQDSFWKDELLPGRRKRPVIMIDFATDQEQKERYRARYSFVEDGKSVFLFDGFHKESVRKIQEG